MILPDGESRSSPEATAVTMSMPRKYTVRAVRESVAFSQISSHGGVDQVKKKRECREKQKVREIRKGHGKGHVAVFEPSLRVILRGIAARRGARVRGVRVCVQKTIYSVEDRNLYICYTPRINRTTHSATEHNGTLRGAGPPSRPRSLHWRALTSRAARGSSRRT